MKKPKCVKTTCKLQLELFFSDSCKKSIKIHQKFWMDPNVFGRHMHSIPSTAQVAKRFWWPQDHPSLCFAYRSCQSRYVCYGLRSNSSEGKNASNRQLQWSQASRDFRKRKLAVASRANVTHPNVTCRFMRQIQYKIEGMQVVQTFEGAMLLDFMAVLKR